MSHHIIVRCSCGAVIEPCACGEIADSQYDPHEVDMRAGCASCRPTDRFGAAHAHDLDNDVNLEPK